MEYNFLNDYSNYLLKKVVIEYLALKGITDKKVINVGTL